ITKTGTPSGDDCSWSVTYNYAVVDDCGNECQEINITYSGGDNEAPILTGVIPVGATDMDLCFADIPVGPSEAEIALLYTDNCGAVSVTKTGTPSGDDCSWSVTYNYVIVDDCGNDANEIDITFSGGDNEAPILTGVIPVGATDMDLCFADIPVGPSEAEIAALYTDNCGAVSVTKTGTPSGDDCSWSVTYNYVIVDDCGNDANEIDITFSGGDNEAPTASNPDPITVACIDDIPNADITVVTDAADNCGVAIVTHDGDVSDGDSCEPTITRTYKVADACGNFINVTQTINIEFEDFTLPADEDSQIACV
ncbi:HYR-like domain-containing protein, partial [Planktosalinus lacus]|uniref:HYR-like domain-containing protein n=1 Tax=Planktosalinus lacus TaxID=1526573 RepID=UPI00166B88E0